jgi:hypothetical protein
MGQVAVKAGKPSLDRTGVKLGLPSTALQGINEGIQKNPHAFVSG